MKTMKFNEDKKNIEREIEKGESVTASEKFRKNQTGSWKKTETR